MTDPVVLTALQDTSDWPQYVKLHPVRARQMAVDFSVETTEGVMQGHAGDYLCVDVLGHPYPCAKAVFETTYRPLEPVRKRTIEAIHGFVSDIVETNEGS